MSEIKQIKLANNEALLQYDATDCLNPTRLFVYKYGEFPNIMGLNPSEELRRCLKGITFNFDVEETIQALLDENIEIEVNRIEDIDENGNRFNKRVVINLPEYKCLIYSREELLNDNQNVESTSDFQEVYYSYYDQVKPIIDLIWKKSYTKIDKSVATNFFAIKQTPAGFILIPRIIGECDVNIKDNYNDDFKKAHDVISKFIAAENEHGIVILNGSMGTGKSYYLRNLITSNPDIHFIWGTRRIAENLSEPGFIDFLSKNQNSVLILEDCENIVKKRSMNEGSAITNLLNIGDGLLSDSLNIKIIVTFNTDLKNIDTALQRKGRLKYQYTFEELTLEKTKKLMRKLGKKCNNVKEGMTLADIYNYENDNNGYSKKEKIGF